MLGWEVRRSEYLKMDSLRQLMWLLSPSTRFLLGDTRVRSKSQLELKSHCQFTSRMSRATGSLITLKEWSSAISSPMTTF